MCVAPHPRGNCLQQGMVTSRWTTLEKKLLNLAQEEAHTNTDLCTAASRPGEWAAPGTFLAGQSEVGAEWSVWNVWTSQSENWRASDTHARKRRPCSLQSTPPSPSLLWRSQQPLWQENIQSWIHSSPSEQHAWCNKIYAFLYLFSGSTYIFISGPLRFCVVIFKSLLLVLRCGDSSLHFGTRNQKSLQQFY